MLVRLVTLTVSYIFTTICAALFIVFALFLGGDPSWLGEDPVVAGSAALFAATLWWQITQLAFAPYCLIVLALEFGRFRSFIMNSAAGGLCALAVLTLFEEIVFDTDLPYTSNELWTAGIASGFVAGAIHWLIAGHRSGVWMGRPIESEDAS